MTTTTKKIRVDPMKVQVGDLATVRHGKGTKDGVVRQVLGAWVLVEIPRREAYLRPFRWKGQREEIIEAWRTKEDGPEVPSPPGAGEGETRSS